MCGLVVDEPGIGDDHTAGTAVDPSTSVIGGDVPLEEGFSDQG